MSYIDPNSNNTVEKSADKRETYQETDAEKSARFADEFEEKLNKVLFALGMENEFIKIQKYCDEVDKELVKDIMDVEITALDTIGTDANILKNKLESIAHDHKKETPDVKQQTSNMINSLENGKKASPYNATFPVSPGHTPLVQSSDIEQEKAQDNKQSQFLHKSLTQSPVK
jgi:hypothetical protein